MSEENVWASLETAMEMIYRQGKRINEMEQRIANLEARLNETLKPQEVEKDMQSLSPSAYPLA